MRRQIMGAMVLVFGLAMAAGLGGEAHAFAGGVVVDGPKAEVEQVNFKKKHRHHLHHRKLHKRGKFKKGGVFFKFGNGFKGHGFKGRGFRSHGFKGHGFKGHSFKGRGFKPVHRGCHTVSKDGYFNGRHALIGGTKCYNRFGHGFIVDGSRHVIKYY